MVNNSELLLS